MSRAVLLPLAATVLLSTAACTQTVDRGAEGSNFLTLQGYAQVDPEAGELQGYFRWVFHSDDPVADVAARVFCEIWEYTELELVEQSPDCPTCSATFSGSAEVRFDGQTTCEDVSWSERPVELSWAALDELDVDEDELEGYLSEGYSHRVLTPWSPELGSTEGQQELFVAVPEAWSPEDGEVGSSEAETVEGQYRLDARFYWALE